MVYLFYFVGGNTVFFFFFFNFFFLGMQKNISDMDRRTANLYISDRLSACVVNTVLRDFRLIKKEDSSKEVDH